MRVSLKIIALIAPLALAYLAWPIVTAFQVREAMVVGDTPTLARKIDWAALRASLKTSLSPEALARLAASPDAPSPTLWQRIKAAMAPSMADTILDRYVTPDHLPILLGYRRLHSGAVRPALDLQEPPTALAGTLLAGSSLDRFASFWTRVRRAVFQSPTLFVLEVEDKHRPGRVYVGTFALQGWEWKLTGLTVSGGGF